MDYSDARNIFQAPALRPPVPAVAGDEDHDPIDAIEGVNLLELRQAIDRVEANADNGNLMDYGPAANAVFFGAVFNVDPIFQQLVVFNCNAGVFQRRITHINAVKMVQLLSMARLGRARLLPTQTTKKVSYYMSLALAEFLGPHIPADWKLGEEAARREIIASVRWLLTEDGSEASGLERDDWYDAQVLGVEEAILNPGGRMDIDEALCVLEAMAVRLPTNNQWANGISFVATAIVSICRRGTVTDEQRQKVIDGLRDATSSTSVSLSALTVSRFFTYYCKGVNAGNAQAVMNHYGGIIPDNIIVLRNLVIQSAGSGMTTYMVILRALQTYGDFAWHCIRAMAREDFANLLTAINAVGGNVYYGYNRQMATAAARRFPTLAYTSFQLCIQVGGDRPLSRYQGMPQVVPGKPAIDRLITAYINRRGQEIEEAELDEEADAAVQAVRNAVRPAYDQMMGINQNNPNNANN